MRTLIACAVVGLFCSIGHSQPPAGYYDSVDQSNHVVFRKTLHSVIDDHVRFPYTSSAPDTWNVLEEADEDPENSGNILDLYMNDSVPKKGGGNAFYNREHSWPKSYGFPDDHSKNYPYTDCHALFLCNSRYNSSRSNKPYDFASASDTEKPTEETNDSGGGQGVYPGNSNWTRAGVWETWVDRRGDVARALFYMDVRYEGGSHQNGALEPDLILTDNLSLVHTTGGNVTEFAPQNREAYMGMLSVLLTWHVQDPVDEKERRRNDAVFARQKNRNPFIDHPDWVACLFGTECLIDGTVAPTNPPVVPNASVWINEIHYDNVGADQGEFVEIAGPMNTDLTGWKLVGYTGSTGGMYKTVALNGTIGDQLNGFGTLAFDFRGLQNGTNDAIALVNSDGEVVEFISYEGSLTAINGPAEDLGSTDIGAEESGRTPVGQSLQRKGSGQTPTAFSWSEPSDATRGEVNTGQTF